MGDRTHSPAAPVKTHAGAGRSRAPGGHTPAGLTLASAGNQELLHALGAQAKLSVSSPTDPAEQEADRMADAFASNIHIARKCSTCAAEEDEVRRKPAASAGGKGDLPGALPMLGSSNAQPLPRSLRRDYERFFDLDLSGVRIHAGAPAAQASAAVQAQAFTRGHDVYFASDQYRPDTTDGRKLIAHELTHVVQQGGRTGMPRSDAPGSRVRAAPKAAIHRQWWAPFSRVGPSIGRVGPTISRIAPAFERVAPAFERVAPAIERVGPAIERVGPAIERAGPGLDRISPSYRPWSPGSWRPPPSISRPAPTPTPTPTPQPLPWQWPYPVPPVLPMPDTGPQPQPAPEPQPQPQPDEEEQRDPRCGTPQLPLTRVSFFPGPLGQGGRVKASPLTKCPGNTRGSEPLGSIYRAQFDCINAAGQGGSWVRAHLLHGRTSSSGPFNLHGPGTTPENLIITDQSLNQQMRRGAEAPAIARVWGGSQVLWYESKVDAYSPGLDYFGQSITVNYGSYDTATNTEGPSLGGGTYTLKRTPPNCPATPLAPGPGAAGAGAPAAAAAAPAASGAAPSAPAAASGPPASSLLFQSTIRICHRELETRNFRVDRGGLIVRLDARWFNGAGDTELGAAQCPVTGYRIELTKVVDWGFDDDIGTAELTVAQPETLVWRHLEPGEYYMTIKVADYDPNCCLQGDIIVSTFDSPWETVVFDPNMMA